MAPFKFDLETAKSNLGDPYGNMESVVIRKKISLHPKYIGRLKTGITSQLDREKGRFSPSVQGVLIAYDELRLVDELGQLSGDQSSVTYEIQLRCYVFKPQVGKDLKAVVNKISPSHTGFLVHGIFNASDTRGSKGKFELGEEVLLKVDYIDYSGVVYIKGKVVGMEEEEGEMEDLISNMISDNCKLGESRKLKTKDRVVSDTDCQSDVEQSQKRKTMEDSDCQSNFSKKHKKSKKKRRVKEELDSDSPSENRKRKLKDSPESKNKRIKMEVEDASSVEGEAIKKKSKKDMLKSDLANISAISPQNGLSAGPSTSTPINKEDGGKTKSKKDRKIKTERKDDSGLDNSSYTSSESVKTKKVAKVAGF